MPSVPSGRRRRVRSQSSTTSSTAVGPAPPPQEAAMAWNPVPSHSPSTAGYDDGPGTRVKKRG